MSTYKIHLTVAKNNDIDKLNILKKLFFYNYKITNQHELDKIFSKCIGDIFEYINENKGCLKIFNLYA